MTELHTSALLTHLEDLALVPVEGVDALVGAWVPEADLGVLAARGDQGLLRVPLRALDVPVATYTTYPK